MLKVSAAAGSDSQTCTMNDIFQFNNGLGSYLEIEYIVNGRYGTKKLHRNDERLRPFGTEFEDRNHIWKNCPRVQRVIRWKWQCGSNVNVNWHNGWRKGKIISVGSDTEKRNYQLTNTPSSKLRVRLNANGVIVDVNRNNHNEIQPLLSDIQQILMLNRNAFMIPRRPDQDINDLERALDYPPYTVQFKRIRHVYHVMNATDGMDNWLTPESAWNDVCKLVDHHLIGLDPFIGHSNTHIIWCKQRGVTLKQFVTDWNHIQFLPKSIDYFLTNPVYEPRFLRLIFIKLRILDNMFALCVPHWVLEQQWFLRTFNDVLHDVCFFKPQRKYKFERYDQEQRKRIQLTDPPFHPIWLFYRMREYMRGRHKMIKDGMVWRVSFRDPRRASQAGLSDMFR